MPDRPNSKSPDVRLLNLSQTAGTSFLEGLSIDVAGKSADAIRVYRHTGRLIDHQRLACT